VTTALSQTVISGYIDTSAVWNPGTGNANPAPVAFNQGKQDGFNLNVVDLTLEKPLDEGQWSAGYKAELLFGPDAVNYNTSANTLFGLGLGTSDFAIKQAYIALRAPVGNGLDLKVGVFDSIVGYESFASYRNPNYTRSYGYTIQPTEHTGVLASYQISDMFSVSAGVADTLNSGINGRTTRGGTQDESAKTYMGSVTFTAPESMGVFAGSAIYAGIVDGFGSNGTTTSAEDQTSVYVGATIATPVAGLKLGAAYDQAFNMAVPDPALFGVIGKANGGYADAISAYASFQATEKLSLHVRGEYAKVDPLFGGHARVFALTGTVQYDLWENVISRLEVRWDHSTGGNDLFGGKGAGGIGSLIAPSAPNRKNDVTIAANLVYKF
jgi:hypothetical protein